MLHAASIRTTASAASLLVTRPHGWRSSPGTYLRGGSTDRLILARRAVPRPWHLEQVASLEALQGGVVLVPESSAPLWCQVQLRLSIQGRLRNLLLRPSRVMMEYTTKEGTASALVVPAMMPGGFLLAPAVRTTGRLCSTDDEPSGPSRIARAFDSLHPRDRRRLRREDHDSSGPRSVSDRFEPYNSEP